MNQNKMKHAAAQAALRYIQPDSYVGIGTGSTTNHFIDLLAHMKDRIRGAVASSEASEERLKRHGIRVIELNATGDLPVYA